MGIEGEGVSPSIAGIGQRAVGEYARNIAHENHESSSRAGEIPGRTRVRTRTFGLKLGGFGVTYTTEDVQLEPSTPARDTFNANLETAGLRQHMVREAADQTISQSMPPQRRAALRAYSQAHNPGPTARTLLGVA